MCPVSGLCIHSWVPVIVVKDYSIGSSEGYPKATCASAEEEDENVRIVLEFIDHVTTICDVGLTI